MIHTIRFVNTFDTTAPFLRDVLASLARNGWQTEALVSRAEYRQTGDAERQEPLRSVWVPPVIRRSKRGVAFAYMVLAPFYLLARRHEARVFLTQPPLFFILGAWISRLRGVPYAVHIMDMHPDLLACVGLLRKTGPLYRILSRLALDALRKADGVIVIGRCMERRLVEQGLDPKRILRVSNWAPDNVQPTPADRNPFLGEHDLGDRFVVLYMGNMGAGHEFDTALEAAERLRDREDILFLFVGQGARRREVEQAIAAGATNLRLMGPQPLEMLPHVLSAASVHLISLREGFEGVMVPSKFYSALASGRPVLYVGTTVGEVAMAIAEHDCGAVVPPGDVDALVSAIERYRDHPDHAAEAGSRALGAHRDCYEKQRCVEDYTAVIDRIFGDRES